MRQQEVPDVASVTQALKSRESNMIEWGSVSSKAIRKIGYDATSSRIFIDFEDSYPIYMFRGVSEPVFRDFIHSGSVGRYYHQYIKHWYQY